MRPFDLIIFDFDGTLADSANGIVACMEAAFGSFDLPPPLAADVRSRIGLTLEETIRQLASGAIDVAAVAARYRELHPTVAAPAVTLFSGTEQMLSAAKAGGYQLVVVSQKGRRGLGQLLAQLGIDQYFSLVLAADDVTNRKPDAALYEQHIVPFLDAFRLKAGATRPPEPVRPDRVLVVGDTATDIEFAVNIGAPSCWAAYGYGDQSRCVALQPTHRIADILELRTLCGC